MAAHHFDRTVLREYDVRGVVGRTLHAADARALGAAFGTVLRRDGGTRVAVGCDGRLSSPEMEAALVAGLVATGLEVARIGLGPTPMLYFAVHHLDCAGGVMVTGSHNPPDYNGFKMMRAGGPVYGAQIQELGRIAADGAFAGGAGTDRAAPVFDAYVDRLLRDHPAGTGLAVVWDPGNGAAGPVTEALVGRLAGRHRVINAAVDGTFPAHHPDPTVEKNLIQLREAVAAEGAQLGVAFDGDGDRIGVIDARGRVLWGDQLLALLARPVLRQRPGATIIADVKASQVLFDEVDRLGGQGLMWKTGHSLIKAKMKETGAPLAGEMSGHLFFADRWYGFDDALYAALRVLELAAEADGDLARLRDELPSVVNTPELRFPCSEEDKFPAVARVRAQLTAAGARMSEVDGVRVTTADGWWLLRASNTQDVLVARCEGVSVDALDRLKADLGRALAAAGLAVPPM
jgi:phosphomannomutase